jgi:hypothetical protein
VVSPATRFGHTCLGTLLGTVGGFFAGSIQKTEGKRDKATVLLTATLLVSARAALPLAEHTDDWFNGQINAARDEGGFNSRTRDHHYLQLWRLVA